MDAPPLVLTPVTPRPKKDARSELLLPSALKERARQYARRRGLSFNDLVTRLLEHAVEHEEARAA